LEINPLKFFCQYWPYKRVSGTYTGFHGDWIETAMDCAGHDFIQQHVHKAAITTTTTTTSCYHY